MGRLERLVHLIELFLIPKGTLSWKPQKFEKLVLFVEQSTGLQYHNSD